MRKAARASSAASPGAGAMTIWSSASPGRLCPAVGVSIGVDRLLAALDAKGQVSGTRPRQGPVVVTVMDRDRMGDYQQMAATTLRAAGIRAEVYLGNPKNFGNQLKYADKRQSPVAIIQGSATRPSAALSRSRTLILGAEIAETASVEEWKEQKQQFECARWTRWSRKVREGSEPVTLKRPTFGPRPSGCAQAFEARGARRCSRRISCNRRARFWTSMERISGPAPS